ncbi:nitrate transport permease nrtB [Ochrobactrum sp. MYb15]|uniref:ABC transporter permease n=1 Tax=Brucella pituitosa TaxID=571256 RepID=UPI000CFDD5F9|nr:nitrate transport permease nrtB [Ochrobactrum sp. MYb19]PRA60575.1 nitrate transport permease nrtB [Ochrobactrum sp. MYb18]PRA73470.1 nitrate transport permease nrtB [Brucella thiophenivorans]PRA85419.1 nitrate transport permease nrtB [Ochrobactrum sp. MYb14]PRA94993.1 nitrate transport permease nrtB [Ochrobactrum sp. MYb15]
MRQSVTAAMLESEYSNGGSERRLNKPVRRRIQSYLRPRAALSGRERITISAFGIFLFFATWLFVTEAGLIQPFFLPSPIAVAKRLFAMVVFEGYLIDVWSSTYRVFAGFLIAATIAIPIGILIGNFPFFRSLIEPILSTARYLPATAFVPLMIIWLGINESQKIAVIFIGTFFPLALFVASISEGVSSDLMNSAYSLGARSTQVFFKVLLPACIPNILDALRITAGIAWTYVIVAELVGAESGMGIAILQSQRFLLTDQVIAGIVAVGILGVLTDLVFRFAHRKLFPYL